MRGISIALAPAFPNLVQNVCAGKTWGLAGKPMGFESPLSHQTLQRFAFSVDRDSAEVSRVVPIT